MKLNEINIRDPFVLSDAGMYYMYGSRGGKCWGEDDGLDCYYSTDLTEWTGPVEVFHKPDGFWADRNYWAPECHVYRGSYYIFASFKSKERCRGTQILKADHPLGPFHPHSDGPVTPSDWECLDGTLYVSPEGKPYMVFCHEWLQVHDGTICAVPLTDDLKAAAGDVQELFAASDAPWVMPCRPPEKPGEPKNYVTDGPFLYWCGGGGLLMIWSSFGVSGYAVGVAKSLSGDVTGPWKQMEKPLFGENGGHGMIFTSKDGEQWLALHTPNQSPLERPVFYRIREKDGMLEML